MHLRHHVRPNFSHLPTTSHRMTPTFIVGVQPFLLSMLWSNIDFCIQFWTIHDGAIQSLLKFLRIHLNFVFFKKYPPHEGIDVQLYVMSQDDEHYYIYR